MTHGPSHTPSSHLPAPTGPFLHLTTHNVIPHLHTYQLPLASSFKIYIYEATTPSFPFHRLPSAPSFKFIKIQKHSTFVQFLRASQILQTIMFTYFLSLFNNEFNLPGLLLQFSNLHHTYTVKFIRNMIITINKRTQHVHTRYMHTGNIYKNQLSIFL